MTKETIVKLARAIELKVETDHQERKRWNPITGQWLVYGFERYIGFSHAASLCAVIERAYNAKQSIKPVAIEFFTDMYSEDMVNE